MSWQSLIKSILRGLLKRRNWKRQSLRLILFQQTCSRKGNTTILSMTFERAKEENRFDLIWNLSVNEGKSTEYYGITWQKKWCRFDETNCGGPIKFGLEDMWKFAHQIVIMTGLHKVFTWSHKTDAWVCLQLWRQTNGRQKPN